MTDAPLIEPLLLRWTTGATIDAHEGVRQYVSASEKFLLYQSTGQKRGLLAQCVTHPEYDVHANVTTGDSDGEGATKQAKPSKKWLRFGEFWQIHAAPCE